MTTVKTMEQKSRRESDVHVVEGGGPRVAESCVINVSAESAQKGGGPLNKAKVVPDATVGFLEGARYL